MVRRGGQTTAEYLLVLSLLVAIGAYLMFQMVGPNQNDGAISAMAANAHGKISADND